MTTSDTPIPSSTPTEASEPNAGRCAVATGYAYEQSAEERENILARARDPKEGDTYTQGDDRVTVTSYADGVVSYDHFGRFGPTHHTVTIEQWWHKVANTLGQDVEVTFA